MVAEKAPAIPLLIGGNLACLTFTVAAMDATKASDIRTRSITELCVAGFVLSC
jgi:hypothetical protein